MVLEECMSTRILIPTYNEAKNIEDIIAKVFEAVPHASILVVDDSSPDGTGEIVRNVMNREPCVQLLERHSKEGLGKAYLHAFSETLKDPITERIVMMDADFSHDPAYLPAMLKAAEEHDVVVGSRYVRGGATEGWESWRKLLSSGGNLYCRFIANMPINDATGGFNLISAPLLRRIDLSTLDSSGYAFQMELKYLLWRGDSPKYR